jgi:hypothetical protein
MSIPRVALMVGFGLISSSGPTHETVVKAAAAPVAAAQPAPKPGGPITVRIHVLPDNVRGKGKTAIQAWARTQANIQSSDIIVDGRTPWMFMHKTLVEHKHSDHHFELTAVHLPVGEQIRWVSTRRFCITNIKKTGKDESPYDPNSPENPFPKLRAEGGRTRETCSEKNLVDSGPHDLKPPMAQRYKITFTIDGETVDPDIVCEP